MGALRIHGHQLYKPTDLLRAGSRNHPRAAPYPYRSLPNLLGISDFIRGDVADWRYLPRLGWHASRACFGGYLVVRYQHGHRLRPLRGFFWDISFSVGHWRRMQLAWRHQDSGRMVPR